MKKWREVCVIHNDYSKPIQLHEDIMLKQNKVNVYSKVEWIRNENLPPQETAFYVTSKRRRELDWLFTCTS